MTNVRTALIGLAAVTLSGCSGTISKNITGTWTCDTPEGVCDDIANIDKRALQETGGVTQARQSSTGETGATIAPPDLFQQVKDRVPSDATIDVASANEDVTLIRFDLPPSTRVSMPSRRPDEIARIVIPGFVDSDGVIHEQRILYAVMKKGNWNMPVLDRGQ